jgi:tetratricopeptide (TPR) repeat protein
MLGGSDLVSGADYLEQGIAAVRSDITYKKALMQQVSTVLYSSGRCGDAIEVLTELIAMGDEQPSTLNNLAYMVIECENNPQKALGYSTRAIRNNRNVSSYLDTHGYILFKVGDLEEAFRNLKRSVILQPSSSNLLNLAEVLEAMGNKGEAMVTVQRLGREFPQLSPAKQERAKALISRLQ